MRRLSLATGTLMAWPRGPRASPIVGSREVSQYDEPNSRGRVPAMPNGNSAHCANSFSPARISAAVAASAPSAATPLATAAAACGRG